MPKPCASFRDFADRLSSRRAPAAPAAAALEARRAAAEASREAAAAIARAAELAGDTDAEALDAFAAVAAALADRMAEPAGEPMRLPQWPDVAVRGLKPAPPPPPPPSPPKGRNLKTHATWYEPHEHTRTLCGRRQSVDDDKALKLAIKQLVKKKGATSKEMMEGITCESCRNMILDRYLTGCGWKHEMAKRMQGDPFG